MLWSIWKLWQFQTWPREAPPVAESITVRFLPVTLLLTKKVSLNNHFLLYYLLLYAFHCNHKDFVSKFRIFALRIYFLSQCVKAKEEPTLYKLLNTVRVHVKVKNWVVKVWENARIVIRYISKVSGKKNVKLFIVLFKVCSVFYFLQ